MSETTDPERDPVRLVARALLAASRDEGGGYDPSLAWEDVCRTLFYPRAVRVVNALRRAGTLIDAD